MGTTGDAKWACMRFLRLSFPALEAAPKSAFLIFNLAARFFSSSVVALEVLCFEDVSSFTGLVVSVPGESSESEISPHETRFCDKFGTFFILLLKLRGTDLSVGELGGVDRPLDKLGSLKGILGGEVKSNLSPV